MAENTCAQCGRTGVSLMRCTGCKVTYFCDRNCQTLGWKDHKKACKELAKANEAPPAPAPEALAASGAPQKAAPGTSKIQLTMQEGTAFIQENKFQEALAKFTECFELTKDTNLTEPHAICIYFMAVANSKMRQMVAAKKLLEEFFETEFCKTAEPDENPIPQKAYSLGIDVYLMLGDTEGALRCGAEGERLAKESGRRADHCELLLKLGRLNYQIADFETAASTLEQARALAAMLQGSYAQLYQVQGFNLSGAVLMMLERYGEAIECFEGELNVAKEMGGSIAKQIPKVRINPQHRALNRPPGSRGAHLFIPAFAKVPFGFFPGLRMTIPNCARRLRPLGCQN
mmetsp:Transcript_4049/g.12664  ORF Transcript_4049/g.12664 Transcript_4049/m.12664 type:complete len:344 (-) Transcript_4049:1088-2119(-)